MKWIVFRVAAGLVGLSMVTALAVRPPKSFNEGLGMLLPVAMLAGFALRGPRRSLMKRRPLAGSGPQEEVGPTTPER